MEVDAEGALLDFFSDRAVAHAGFFLASIFGLVSLAALVWQLSHDGDLFWAALSLIPYQTFAFLGFWSLRRFGGYASMAHVLQSKLAEHLRDVDFQYHGATAKVQDIAQEEINRQKKRRILMPIFGGRWWNSYVQYFGYLLLVPGALGAIVYSRLLLWFLLAFAVLIVLVGLTLGWGPARQSDATGGDVKAQTEGEKK